MSAPGGGGPPTPAAARAPSPTTPATAPALQVSGLRVSFRRRGRQLPAVAGVDFHIQPGEAFGLVGESGCGKSTVALSLMRFLPRNGRIDGGRILLDGQDLLALDQDELRRWRGRRLAMVYQDPGSALNPVLRVGEQIAEIYRFHEECSGAQARERARAMLELVAMPDPERALQRYPHQLSGGQQQRVVIAMALALNPRLLILDEPTTGLDATVEAEVLELISTLRRDLDAAVLFISHNLGLVARICERMAVMYAGRIVEQGPARQVLAEPRHPYSMGLLRAVPRLGSRKDLAPLAAIPGTLPPLGSELPGCYYQPRCPLARDRCAQGEPELLPSGEGRSSRCYFWEEVPGMPVAIPAEVAAAIDAGGQRADTDRAREARPAAGARAPEARPAGEAGPLLQLRALRKSYGDVVACEDVNLEVAPGEVLGLVGESGSGKTTLARCVAGLVRLSGGDMMLNGRPLPDRVGRRNASLLRAIQMVFQNPDSTLNPRHSVRHILGRAIARLGGRRRVEELAAEVQIQSRQLDVRAVELSGGQKQRVAIGRAFAGSPALVLCDEPVSALDVSVQAAVLNLLAGLQKREGVGYLFISHDLAVVRYLSDRIAVMYLAQLVEVGKAEEVFSAPQHPYTEALLSAIPALDLEAGSVQRERIHLHGAVPSLTKPPSGCRFHTRCPRKLGEICEREQPPWQDAGGGHMIRCHIPPAELRVLQQPKTTAVT